MSAPAPPAEPEYGPTLPALLRARLGWSAPRSAVALAVVVAVVVAAALGLRSLGGGRTLAGDGFSLRYGTSLQRVAPRPGELVRLEDRRGGRLVAVLTLRRLRLPPYSGTLEGELPMVASTVQRRLAARDPTLVAVGEGRLDSTAMPLYGVGYVTRRGGERVYGMEVLAVPGGPGARDGFELSALATRASGVRSAAGLAAGGPLRAALTSFEAG